MTDNKPFGSVKYLPTQDQSGLYNMPRSNRPLVKSANEKIFFFISTKTYVVGTQKNRLDETVLLSTQNIC